MLRHLCSYSTIISPSETTTLNALVRFDWLQSRYSARGIVPSGLSRATKEKQLCRCMSFSTEPLPSAACSLLQRAKSEKWTMYTLKEGLGSLPEALHRYLQEHGTEIHLGMPCSGLEFKDDKVTVTAYVRYRAHSVLDSYIYVRYRAVYRAHSVLDSHVYGS